MPTPILPTILRSALGASVTEDSDSLTKRLLQSGGMSYSLKTAVRALLKRDPTDAVNDAEALLELMILRMQDANSAEA